MTNELAGDPHWTETVDWARVRAAYERMIRAGEMVNEDASNARHARQRWEDSYAEYEKAKSEYKWAIPSLYVMSPKDESDGG